MAHMSPTTPAVPSGGVDNCEWFLKCPNPATGTLPHPVLGGVPVCDRCRRIADPPMALPGSVLWEARGPLDAPKDQA